MQCSNDASHVGPPQQAWPSSVRGRGLSGSAFVMVMQTADFRRLNYFALGNGLYDERRHAGYYVNCNSDNRQLLNGYVPANSKEAPHSRAELRLFGLFPLVR